MGRLIDADALMKEYPQASGLKLVIENAPTAYDIEKVVAELEKAKKYVTIDGKNTGLEALHPIQAIDIVKRGGVE